MSLSVPDLDEDKMWRFCRVRANVEVRLTFACRGQVVNMQVDDSGFFKTRLAAETTNY